MLFKCNNCGGTITRESLNGAVCTNCGSEFKVVSTAIVWKDFLIGLIIGTILIAPFFWVPLGRSMVKESIRRGARIPKKKIEKWIEQSKEKR